MPEQDASTLEYPPDRLQITSYRWAYESATFAEVRATDPTPNAVKRQASANLRRAEPGPLVAMKLKACLDRPRTKEATDVADILRLISDLRTSAAVNDQLETLDPPMARDVWWHAERELVSKRASTIALLRQHGLGMHAADAVDDAAAFLDHALRQRST